MLRMSGIKSPRSKVENDLKSVSIPKLNIFLWLFAHGKLHMAENLRKRDIAGPSKCGFCNQAEESMQHIFFDCRVTKEVRSLPLEETGQEAINISKVEGTGSPGIEWTV
jgi:hypothetical protein